ncbi:hypothetical protein TEA_019605 [Camellia sinensis var. sinensis]|uniref:PPM-type phosphatase domain-containing protein n=1 Tax=Camellia sinensis var. sinensis TaxID=542762 RepID=A0A4S4EXX3_CAMSN|nr:hypothetical protein TEA_019605 [Camellia sinensis var. sinensis]
MSTEANECIGVVGWVKETASDSQQGKKSLHQWSTRPVNRDQQEAGAATVIEGARAASGKLRTIENRKNRLSQKSHNYFSNRIRFEDYDQDAVYNVVDDIKYSTVPIELMKNLANVDVWHCPSTEALSILSRTKSVGLPQRQRDLLLGGFGENGSVIDECKGCFNLSEIDVCRGGDGASDVDPGPSISEVGAARKDEVDKRCSVVMDDGVLIVVLETYSTGEVVVSFETFSMVLRGRGRLGGWAVVLVPVIRGGGEFFINPPIGSREIEKSLVGGLDLFCALHHCMEVRVSIFVELSCDQFRMLKKMRFKLVSGKDRFVCLPERWRDLLLGGFGESGSVIDERRGRFSLSETDVCRGGDGASDVDLDLSISEVSAVRKDEIDKRWSVVMDSPEFSDLESIYEDAAAADRRHNPLSNFIPTLRSGEWSDIGDRLHMEDTHICITDLAQNFGCNLLGEEAVSFYGVSSLTFFDHCLSAVTVSTINISLLVANAGDCRAVLSRHGMAIEMSKDHRPCCNNERIRIESLGGFIDDGYLNGQLGVTRALGDWHINGLNSQNAVDFARKKLQEHNDVKLCCKEIVKEAIKRGAADNLTVVMVCFHLEPPPPHVVVQRPRFKRSISAEGLRNLKCLLEG